jgi:cytochrome c-type biogenesis protein CcmH
MSGAFSPVLGWRGWLSRAFLLALLMQFAGPWNAQAQVPEEEVRRIARQLRCPICESVSVADSPAELAVQMRDMIRKKLEAGESERQILDYFVTAYGDSVLLEPPRRGLGWLIWAGPPLVLGLSALVLCLLVRGWVRTGRRVTPADLASGQDPLAEAASGPVELARQELETIRRSEGR